MGERCERQENGRGTLHGKVVVNFTFCKKCLLFCDDKGFAIVMVDIHCQLDPFLVYVVRVPRLCLQVLLPC